MRIELTGRHFQLDDQIRSYSEEQLEKLLKYLEEPIEIQVVLEVEKSRQIAELIISHRLGSLHAKEESHDMQEAIHAAVEKAGKQARRSKKKFVDKRRRLPKDHNWPLEILEAESVEGGERPRIIRTTALPIKPMSLEDAAKALDLSKNEFYVFLNSETETVSVLYRRKDDNYGLIVPDL